MKKITTVVLLLLTVVTLSACKRDISLDIPYEEAVLVPSTLTYQSISEIPSDVYEIVSVNGN